MNERIQGLAEQAEIWANQFEEHWGDGPDTNELFKKKFAELIVKECIAWVEDNNGHDGPSISEMKEHFGVEE